MNLEEACGELPEVSRVGYCRIEKERLFEYFEIVLCQLRELFGIRDIASYMKVCVRTGPAFLPYPNPNPRRTVTFDRGSIDQRLVSQNGKSTRCWD